MPSDDQENTLVHLGLHKVPPRLWQRTGKYLKTELMFIGRTDTEAETPILWPPHVNS